MTISDKPLRGYILANKSEADLTENDYGTPRLLEAARKRNIDISVFTPNQFEMIVTKDDKKSILIDDKITDLPDFILPRTGSGTTYYALSVIRQLEHLGIYVCNGASSIETVKDKLHMHQLLAHSRLPTPKTMLAKYPINTKVVAREIGFPAIIKNVTGSFGSGIYLCESEEKFNDIIELIYTNNEKANIIIQEFIKDSSGKDLRVFILGGKVIGCMQRTSKGSFKANVAKGGSVSAFEASPEIEWLSTEAARLVGLDVAGIDLLFDGNGFKICEANSAPDFKGMEEVVGKRIAEDIMDFIQVKVQGKL